MWCSKCALVLVGRVLNVVVCAADTNEPPRVLNYLTAPQVVVWSAVAASSAFPGLFPAQDIKARNTKGENVSFSLQVVDRSAAGFTTVCHDSIGAI